jgi:hypothetical protein
MVTPGHLPYLYNRLNAESLLYKIVNVQGVR